MSGASAKIVAWAAAAVVLAASAWSAGRADTIPGAGESRLRLKAVLMALFAAVIRPVLVRAGAGQ